MTAANDSGRIGAISGPVVVGYIIGRIGDAGVFTLGVASFVAGAFIAKILEIETRGRTVEETSHAEENTSSYPKLERVPSTGP